MEWIISICLTNWNLGVTICSAFKSEKKNDMSEEEIVQYYPWPTRVNYGIEYEYGMS